MTPQERPRIPEIKSKIIDTFLKLIGDNSYSKVSSRRIAKEMGISVGTLYYHFPKGKISILKSLIDKFTKELKLDEILFDGVITDDELRTFFLRDLEMARKYREVLISIEIEQLNDPDFFIAIGQKIDFKKEIAPFIKMFEKIAGKKLNETQIIKIISIWKALIRRHVFFRNLFGSDEDFMNMMIKIIRALSEE
ncbi:MAG: TetR/AcrR family transcriptional regulator [Promethearchaeota archaeon]